MTSTNDAQITRLLTEDRMLTSSYVFSVVAWVCLALGLLMIYQGVRDAVTMKQQGGEIKTYEASSLATLPKGTQGWCVVTGVRMDRTKIVSDKGNAYVPLGNLPSGRVSAALPQVAFLKVDNALHGKMLSGEPTVVSGYLGDELPSSVRESLFAKVGTIPERTVVIDLSARLPPSVKSVSQDIVLGLLAVIGAWSVLGLMKRLRGYLRAYGVRINQVR